MALLTDDCDIRDTTFWMELGGNGDYYINLLETRKGAVIRLSTRFAMSGGGAPLDVKLAIANLFKTMDAAGLNNHPKDEKH